jgi:hypothetical protein
MTVEGQRCNSGAPTGPTQKHSRSNLSLCSSRRQSTAPVYFSITASSLLGTHALIPVNTPSLPKQNGRQDATIGLVNWGLEAGWGAADSTMTATYDQPTLMENEFELSLVESEAYRRSSPMRIRRIMTKSMINRGPIDSHIRMEFSY